MNGPGPFCLPSLQLAWRHRYNAVQKAWVRDEIKVKMEDKPFAHGAMRECFRLKKLSTLYSEDNQVAQRTKKKEKKRKSQEEDEEEELKGKDEEEA